MLVRHAVLALALLACTDQSPSSPIEPGGVAIGEIPIGQNRAVDILFVIDDSASMADEQSNLAANFPNFINVLDTLYGGRPDLHVGVVTGDLGAKGTLDGIGGTGIPGCTGNGGDGRLRHVPGLDGNYIRDVQTEFGRETNYGANSLTSIFFEMAKVGTQGCEVQQPLAAMQRTFENPQNAGFLRDHALLMIVFITDEDDCTFQRGSEMLFGDYGPVHFRCTRYGITCDEGGATPDAMAAPGEKRLCHPSGTPLLAALEGYRQVLRELKPNDPSKVFVTAIVGDGDSIVVEPGPSLGASCQWNEQTATLAVRLRAFADLFPSRNEVQTLCQPDLAGALQPLAGLFLTTLAAPCFESNLLDTDPAPGLQPECVMTWTTPNRTELVPACADEPTALPCYSLVEKPEVCGDLLWIQTYRNQAPVMGTVQRLECVTAR